MVLDKSGTDCAQSTTSGKVACIQIGSIAFLMSGFYYGLRQRSQSSRKEYPPTVLKHTDQSKRAQLVPKKYSRLESLLGLDKKLSASAAAWRSLLGGTLVCVAGYGALALGIAAIINVYNLPEFRTTMEYMLPGWRHAISMNMGSQPKETSDEMDGQDEDLKYLANIFQSALVDDEEALSRHDTQSTNDDESDGKRSKRE